MKVAMAVKSPNLEQSIHEQCLNEAGKYAFLALKILGYSALTNKNAGQRWISVLNNIFAFISIILNVVFLTLMYKIRPEFYGLFFKLSSDAVMFTLWGLSTTLNGVIHRLYGIVYEKVEKTFYSDNVKTFVKIMDLANISLSEFREKCNGIFLVLKRRFIFLALFLVMLTMDVTFGEQFFVGILGFGDISYAKSDGCFSITVLLGVLWSYFVYFHALYCVWLAFYLRVYAMGYNLLGCKVKDLLSGKFGGVNDICRIHEAYDILSNQVEKFELMYGFRVTWEILLCLLSSTSYFYFVIISLRSSELHISRVLANFTSGIMLLLVVVILGDEGERLIEAQYKLQKVLSSAKLQKDLGFSQTKEVRMVSKL